MCSIFTFCNLCKADPVLPQPASYMRLRLAAPLRFGGRAAAGKVTCSDTNTVGNGVGLCVCLQGMAFSLEERLQLGIHGLLPPCFISQDVQLLRVLKNYDMKRDDLDRWGSRKERKYNLPSVQKHQAFAELNSEWSCRGFPCLCKHWEI